MKALFIVNPAAGHGRAEKDWSVVEARVLAALPGSKARRTQRPGHAYELVRQGLQEGFEAVVAVGGDGTVGEAGDAYLWASEALRGKALLGTWPMGSGCDLARHLGLRGDAESMLDLFRRRAVRRLDAGFVEFAAGGRTVRRHFLNVVTLGLGGEVARTTRAGGKPLGGTLSYMLHSLAAVLRAKPYLLTLAIDGVEQANALYHLVAVANTSSTGGGMLIAPQAGDHDGEFDCVTVGPLPRWELLLRFPSIYSGSHIGTPGILHRRARSVAVRSSQTVYLNIDGEAIGTLPAVFSIKPGAVPFLCS